MQRDSFIFYRSFFEATRPLSTEQKAALFDTICGYALDQNELDNDDLIVGAMFSLIRPQLDSNHKKWKDGCKGGRPKKTSGYLNDKTLGYENKKPNVNVNVECNNDNDNDNEKKRGRTPASII